MVYQKLNLTDGTVLTAEHLAHMEDGIAAACNFDAENAGKLLFVGNDGAVSILAIGAGLQIVNGILSVIGGGTGGSDPGTGVDPDPTVAAICGQAVCGQVICGGA